MTGSPRLLATACCLLPLWLSGCGVSAYEDRLRRTNERNHYLARLDEHLDPYWSHAAYGLWLRPPKGFITLPAPAPPKEEGASPPPDRRQEFQGTPLDLPGVIHAWDGVLPLAGGGTGPYRLYVLGNHERFLAADRYGKPADFYGALEASLQTLYGVELPPGDTGRGDENNVKYRQTIPPAEQYNLPKLFQGVNFASANPRRAVPFHAWLYEHTSGQVQCAVLLLTPPNPSPAVRQSLLLALETLRVSPQPPRAQPGGGTTSTPGRAPQF